MSLATVILLSTASKHESIAALFQLRDNKPGLSYANQWVFPGGHGDPGEEVEQTARREFQEETGYCCGELKYLKTGKIPIEARVVEVEIFWTTYDQIQKIECYEGQEMRFIARSEAAELGISPQFLQWWDDAIAEFNKIKTG